MTSDPRLENYDRGEPLGSVHSAVRRMQVSETGEQLSLDLGNVAQTLSLAAAKARAVRAVAARHREAFIEEMNRLGWEYIEPDQLRPSRKAQGPYKRRGTRPGADGPFAQWVRREPR